MVQNRTVLDGDTRIRTNAAITMEKERNYGVKLQVRSGNGCGQIWLGELVLASSSALVY